MSGLDPELEKHRVNLRGQPRLALLFCWYHLPNFLQLYITIIFHVILCYVFVHVFVTLNLNLVINSFIQTPNRLRVLKTQSN